MSERCIREVVTEQKPAKWTQNTRKDETTQRWLSSLLAPRVPFAGFRSLDMYQLAQQAALLQGAGGFGEMCAYLTFALFIALLAVEIFSVHM